MSSRKENEQRTLDIVAGRTDGSGDAGARPEKSGLGGMEMAGIALWLLVLAGGGLVAVYYFMLAPK
jgi:hypothetical protein